MSLTDDMWVTAARDVTTDEADHRLALARVRCAELWPFLSAAVTPVEYAQRRALVAERIEAAVDSVSPRDDYLLGQVVGALNEDFRILHSAREPGRQMLARVEAELLRRAPKTAAPRDDTHDNADVDREMSDFYSPPDTETYDPASWPLDQQQQMPRASAREEERRQVGTDPMDLPAGPFDPQQYPGDYPVIDDLFAHPAVDEHTAAADLDDVERYLAALDSHSALAPEDHRQAMGDLWSWMQPPSPVDHYGSEHASHFADWFIQNHIRPATKLSDIPDHTAAWNRYQQSGQLPRAAALGEATATDYDQAKRDEGAKDGHCMADGSFPIYNATDVQNAKHDLGRTNHPQAQVVDHINRWAREYGESPVSAEKSSRLAICRKCANGTTPDGQACAYCDGVGSLDPVTALVKAADGWDQGLVQVGAVQYDPNAFGSERWQKVESPSKPEWIHDELLTNAPLIPSPNPLDNPADGNEMKPKPDLNRVTSDFTRPVTDVVERLAARVVAANPDLSVADGRRIARATLERFPAVVSKVSSQYTGGGTNRQEESPMFATADLTADHSGGWARPDDYWGTYQHGQTGEKVHLYRGRRNRARFYDEQRRQVGPEQSNVAPAVAWALSHGYFSPDLASAGIFPENMKEE